jgi:hypothetical protein
MDRRLGAVWQMHRASSIRVCIENRLDWLRADWARIGFVGSRALCGLRNASERAWRLWEQQLVGLTLLFGGACVRQCEISRAKRSENFSFLLLRQAEDARRQSGLLNAELAT